MRACCYNTLRRAPHSFLTRCIGWRNNNRSLLWRREVRAWRRLYVGGGSCCWRDLCCAWRIQSSEGLGAFSFFFKHEAADVRDVRRSGGEHAGLLCRWLGGKVDGVSPRRPQSSWYQLRPVDDCIPARMRGNDARRRNNLGRNVSWRNGLLQRKSGLDCGTQLNIRM